MAATSDKLKKTYNAGNPTVTFVSSPRTGGATTLACDNLTGWPTDTAVDFVTYQLETDGETPKPGTQTDWVGVVSGSSITNLVRKAGAADTGNAQNDIVEAMPTATWGNDLVEAVLTHADQDGTLKAGAVDNAAVLANNVVTTAKILDANITTSKINDNAVTASKLGTGAIKLGIAKITANAAGISSSSPTQIAGLSVTVDIPDGGRDIEVTAYFPNIGASAGGVSYTFGLWDGTVGAGTNFANSTIGVPSGFAGSFGIVVGTLTAPSAGTKTFNASLAVPSGTGTVNAGTTSPAFISVKAI